jgi:hypothetical protein
MPTMEKNRNFEEAVRLANDFGAKPPCFDATSPAAQCWIDRVEWLPYVADRGLDALIEAIEEADKYAGHVQLVQYAAH